jgi:hypothetical protein
MFSKIGGLARAGFLTLTAAAMLSAAAVSFTETSGYTYIEGIPATFDTGQISGPSSGSVGPTVVGSESAYSFGSADFGVLRGFSTATSTNPFLMPQTQLNALWEDTIHVLSPVGLPDGTPATIFLTLHLSDTLTSVPFVAGVSNSNAWAYLDGLGANAGIFVHDAFDTPEAANISILYNTLVGADVLIGASLQTNAGPQNAFATADGSNTGLFAMNILTEGVSYTSASGTVYATSIVEPTPEPGTMSLMGITLLVALYRRRAGAAGR